MEVVSAKALTFFGFYLIEAERATNASVDDPCFFENLYMKSEALTKGPISRSMGTIHCKHCDVYLSSLHALEDH